MSYLSILQKAQESERNFDLFAEITSINRYAFAARLLRDARFSVSANIVMDQSDCLSDDLDKTFAKIDSEIERRDLDLGIEIFDDSEEERKIALEYALNYLESSADEDERDGGIEWLRKRISHNV